MVPDTGFAWAPLAGVLAAVSPALGQSRRPPYDPAEIQRKTQKSAELQRQVLLSEAAVGRGLPPGRSRVDAALGSWAWRVGVALGELAGCSGCVEGRAVGRHPPSLFAVAALFGFAGILLLVFAGFAVFLDRRRRRRRLLKILVAAAAGGVCGTLWVVVIATTLDAARPGTVTDPFLAAVGVVVALSVTVLLSSRGRLGAVVGRALMTTGFNSLVLPLAALLSVLVGGAQRSPGSARAEFSAASPGGWLPADAATVGLSVGGLLAGVYLIFLGDRLLRQVRRARHGRDIPTFIRGFFPR